MLDENTRLTIELTDDRPERFTGTPAEIVAAMNESAFAPCETARAFMARWNQFYEMVNGRAFRTESAAAFVEDMLEAGAAVRVDE
ncbi:MAG: hypothetical protein EOM21_13150 [Gammaproteobacteria bacterium]|nr:hypothetical protein [Gammaproteobacteria bacterium]